MELLIALAIIVILVASAVPISIKFYQAQQLDTVADGLTQTLRRAQTQAMAQASSSYGVYVGSGQSGQYVLYRGSSYSSRDDEEVFDAPLDLSFSGLAEVNFSILGGVPSASGNFFLMYNNATATIQINEIGQVERQ